MREKKPYVVISFDTTTDAIAMETICREQGIPGRIIPLPKEISAGCGLSWRIGRDDYEQFKDKIDNLPVKKGKIVPLML